MKNHTVRLLPHFQLIFFRKCAFGKITTSVELVPCIFCCAYHKLTLANRTYSLIDHALCFLYFRNMLSLHLRRCVAEGILLYIIYKSNTFITTKCNISFPTVKYIPFHNASNQLNHLYPVHSSQNTDNDEIVWLLHSSLVSIFSNTFAKTGLNSSTFSPQNLR